MNVLSKMYRGTNDFDFPKIAFRAGIVSVVLIILSIGSIVVQGLNLSLDFEGGSSWEVPSAEFTEEQAGEVLAANDASDGARYQRFTMVDGTEVLRITASVDDIDTGTVVARDLAEAAGLDSGDVAVSIIGPSWGADITNQALKSLVWFFLLIGGYLAWRLEPKMALGSLIAVVHDLIITVGVYSIFQLQVTPATVVAFLTILGYSLYDNVVVCDRLQEMTRHHVRGSKYTYTAITRRTLNDTLMRCINTALTAILPIIGLLVVGGVFMGEALLMDFSVALLIGLLLGMYSSVFIAVPLVAVFKERETTFREIREKLIARGVDVSDTSWKEPLGAVPAGLNRKVVASRSTTSPATAAEGESTTSGSSHRGTDMPAPALGITVDGRPPRPRKKRK